MYRNVGGHAYDAVYSGPMGKVLTPLLSQGTEGRDLPHGSTLCGACAEACPVRIPLADMLVHLRADLGAPQSTIVEGRPSRVRRAGFALWSRAWSSPRGYRATTAVARLVPGAGGWLRHGLPRWTATRDLPRPARHSFRDQWARGR